MNVLPDSFITYAIGNEGRVLGAHYSAHKLARQVCEEMVGLGEKELLASQLSSCVSS